LKNETVLLEQDILTLVGGNENKYNTLREYIIDRSIKSGIMKLLPVFDIQKVIHKACTALEITLNKEKRVLDKFEEIARGKNYNVLSGFNGKKQFYNVLQEMLIKSEYGNIQAGTEIGDYYCLDDSEYERKKYIRDELEDICLQIESCMRHPMMYTLYVNIRYPIRHIVEECLNSIKFNDGMTLAQKVKSIEYTVFETDSLELMRVSVPTYYGNLNDWNTSQAVWRINQDLRPDDFFKQWTIDRYFMEELFEKYNQVEEIG